MYAFCSNRTGEWISHLTVGCGLTVGGMEYFYPAYPLTTKNPEEALLRMSLKTANNVLSKVSVPFEFEIVELK